MNTIEMLREVGFAALGQGYPAFEKFERLVELVRADEREMCAKVCDEIRHPRGYSAESQDWVDCSNHCAEAIRARNKE
jgi:hypothetical protein